jgi:methionyl-tRNA formyltransferase
VTRPFRSVFFGTPEIAVPALRALVETSEVAGVVCQPDRPAGRGLELHEPAVKRAARELGLEVHQPVKVKTGNLHEWLAERAVDVAVVLAYGRILPEAVLGAPRRGCLNLHASVLPRHRGAAPIQWALLAGDSSTGISLMQMDAGLDTGPVFVTRTLPIEPDESAGELAVRLAELAAVAVREDIPRAVRGELVAVPQEDAAATHAPPIEREHARLDWSRPAIEIDRRVRAMAPRPGAYTTVRGKTLKILRARPLELELALQPGTVDLSANGEARVATGSGAIAILRAQVEGRKPLDVVDLVNGRMLRPADVLE